MKVSVYSLTGEVIKKIDISDDIFAVPFNQAVVHQAMVQQLANARQGTASTKTRGQVASSNIKPFRQKGTGFARAGDRSSPLRRGGGITFGPKPRSYRQEMPKRMRQLALKCVLSAKAGEKELMVLEKLKPAEPKTKKMAQILTKLGVGTSALIVTDKPEDNVVKSARNLVGVKTLPASLLNVIDVLSHKRLLMTVAAVRQAEKLWGKGLSQGESGEPLPDTAPTTNN
ncbi:MAG: 50S ribosomal protein L4 [Dehalococcoidia bacterium]|nr:MAG: 50S ribosomal protein L4 [Dehalococcoidia bacterium]